MGSPATLPADPYAAYGGSIATAAPSAPAPAPAPAASNDPYAAYGGSMATPPAAAPAAQPVANPLTANPQGEGTYQMHGAQGILGVPYSQVETARKQGYDFITPSERDRNMKDVAADPATVQRMSDMFGDSAEGDLINAGIGAVKSAAQVPVTLAGWLDSLANKIDEKTGDTADQGQQFESATRKVLGAAAHPKHGGAQQVGGVAQMLGEFAFGEGEARAAYQALPFAAKMKKVGAVADFLEKHPAIAKTVAIGLRQGAAGAGVGVQTLAHGGTAGQAETAGEQAAALGTVLEGGASVAGKVIDHLRPDVESIGGKDVPVLKSQQFREGPDGEPQGPSAAQILAATTDNSHKVVGQQAAAAKRAITDEAQGAAQSSLLRANRARQGPAVPRLPARTGPYTFRIGGTPAAEDVAGDLLQPAAKRTQAAFREPSYVTSSAPKPTVPGIEGSMGGDIATSGSYEPAHDVASGGGQLLTQDANVAAAHLQSLHDVIHGPEFDAMPPEQQQGILAQHEDMQRQMAEHFQSKHYAEASPGPNFQPIDTVSAVQRIGNFSDAADEAQAPGKQVYDHLNAVTGGEWQGLNERIKSLQAQYWTATGAQRDAVEAALRDARGQLDEVFANPKAGIERGDLAAAKRSWSDGYVLRDVHAAIEPAFDIDADFAKKTGAYRGFNGNMMQARWKELLQRNPDVRRVLGDDRVNSLSSIFNLNRTMADRARFGGVINKIAEQLSRHWIASNAAIAGAVGGLGYHTGNFAHSGEALGAYAATRLALHAVATNPRVAENLAYGLHYGADVHRLAPVLAAQILDNRKDTQPQN